MQPGSHHILDMTEPLQWARYHWQRLIGRTNADDDERPYSYSSLLACGGKSSQPPRLAGKHRVVVPHLQLFKEEYEKFSGTYVNNRIRTTKYTLLNFVPRNLFEQFHRYFYFWEKNLECSLSFWLIYKIFHFHNVGCYLSLTLATLSLMILVGSIVEWWLLTFL